MALQLIVKGYINKQISRFLDVSVRTLGSRRQQIFLKSGASNLGELMWHAMMLKTDGYESLTDERQQSLQAVESHSLV